MATAIKSYAISVKLDEYPPQPFEDERKNTRVYLLYRNRLQLSESLIADINQIYLYKRRYKEDQSDYLRAKLYGLVYYLPTDKLIEYCKEGYDSMVEERLERREEEKNRRNSYGFHVVNSGPLFLSKEYERIFLDAVNESYLLIQTKSDLILKYRIEYLVKDWLGKY